MKVTLALPALFALPALGWWMDTNSVHDKRFFEESDALMKRDSHDGNHHHGHHHGHGHHHEGHHGHGHHHGHDGTHRHGHDEGHRHGHDESHRHGHSESHRHGHGHNQHHHHGHSQDHRHGHDRVHDHGHSESHSNRHDSSHHSHHDHGSVHRHGLSRHRHPTKHHRHGHLHPHYHHHHTHHSHPIRPCYIMTENSICRDLHILAEKADHATHLVQTGLCRQNSTCWDHTREAIYRLEYGLDLFDKYVDHTTLDKCFTCKEEATVTDCYIHYAESLIRLLKVTHEQGRYLEGEVDRPILTAINSLRAADRAFVLDLGRRINCQGYLKTIMHKQGAEDGSTGGSVQEAFNRFIFTPLITGEDFKNQPSEADIRAQQVHKSKGSGKKHSGGRHGHGGGHGHGSHHGHKHGGHPESHPHARKHKQGYHHVHHHGHHHGGGHHHGHHQGHKHGHHHGHTETHTESHRHGEGHKSEHDHGHKHGHSEGHGHVEGHKNRHGHGHGEGHGHHGNHHGGHATHHQKRDFKRFGSLFRHPSTIRVRPEEPDIHELSNEEKEKYVLRQNYHDSRLRKALREGSQYNAAPQGHYRVFEKDQHRRPGDEHGITDAEQEERRSYGHRDRERHHDDRRHFGHAGDSVPVDDFHFEDEADIETPWAKAGENEREEDNGYNPHHGPQYGDRKYE